jgi:putative transposase
MRFGFIYGHRVIAVGARVAHSAASSQPRDQPFLTIWKAAHSHCPSLGRTLRSSVAAFCLHASGPNKVRGVERVDDRRVLNGIFWRLRTGAPQADIPERYGPHTTCVNRFNRWRKADLWDRLLEAVSKAYDGDIQMIDSSNTRVHQHVANAQKKTTDPVAWVARGAV